MRAAVMHDTEDIRVEDVDVPGPDDLLLEVRAAGVCGSDVGEFYDGPSMFPIHQRHPITGHAGPMIPGHEFGGRVIEVGPGVDGFTEGDLVASGAGVSCGECLQCRTGRTNLCTNYWTVGLQRNGGLAQYVAVPASACIDVGVRGLDDDRAALVQPMAIAVHAMGRGRPDTDEDYVVLGVGGIGAFLVYALAEGGRRVVAVDLNPDRLEIARALGADATINAGIAEDLTAAIRDVAATPRIVYEVTGSEPGLTAAMDVVLPGGRVVAIGLQKAPRSLDVRALTLQEKELLGTNAHAFPTAFPEAARLIASRAEGWHDVAPVALTLEQLATETFPAMRAGVSPRIKTLFDPWASEPRPANLV